MMILQGNASESEQDELASSIIEVYFSEFLIPEARSTFGIMVHALGQIESWAIEDKALYSSLLEKYGGQKEDWPLYGVPSDTDIQEDDAISRAAAKLSQAFGRTEEYLLTCLSLIPWWVGYKNDTICDLIIIGGANAPQMYPWTNVPNGHHIVSPPTPRDMIKDKLLYNENRPSRAVFNLQKHEKTLILSHFWPLSCFTIKASQEGK